MKRRPARDHRQLVILTGLSGSGKSTVLKTFEDLGFYCVDNLPVALIPTFSELHMHGGGEIQRAALLVDAREGGQLEKLPDILRQLRAENPATLVFIEATEEALLRRFSETRRPHPLGHDRPVMEGLRRESVLMEPIRKLADVVIDTTKFNVHELRQFITHRFQKTDHRPMMVSVVSFGYRYGIPADADLVFDVRFLPNPHFVPKLRKYSGRDPARGALHSFVSPDRRIPAARRRIADLPDSRITFGKGKSYLTIAFGCTGGRHRSVMLAEAVRKTLHGKGYASKVVHRDLAKQG